MLIPGDKLTHQQRSQVLAAFTYRWTRENARQNYGGRCPACEQVAPFPYTCGQALADGPKTYTREQWHAYHAPPTSDAEWLTSHAFHFTKSGRLSRKHNHAEPI